MPADYPLDLYRGDTRVWQFRFWEDAEKTQAMDLAGVTAAATISSATSELVVAVMEPVVTLPNIVDVKLTAAEAKKLTTKAAHWDLQFTYSDGSVWTPVAGRVQVNLDATV